MNNCFLYIEPTIHLVVKKKKYIYIYILYILSPSSFTEPLSSLILISTIALLPLSPNCRSSIDLPMPLNHSLSLYLFSLHYISLSLDWRLLVVLNMGFIWIRDWPKLHRCWHFVWVILLQRNHQPIGLQWWHGHGSWWHMGCGLWVRCVMGFVAKVSTKLRRGGGPMGVAWWWVVVAWRL